MGYFAYGFFEVHCQNKDKRGDSCRLARSNKAAIGERLLTNPGAGRSLGLLVAWCLLGQSKSTKADHKGFVDDVTLEERVSARKHFCAKYGKQAEEFCSMERDKEAGEPDEPDVIE